MSVPYHGFGNKTRKVSVGKELPCHKNASHTSVPSYTCTSATVDKRYVVSHLFSVSFSPLFLNCDHNERLLVTEIANGLDKEGKTEQYLDTRGV